MNLKSIRRVLARELTTKASMKLFDVAKQRYPVLADYSTVLSALAALEDENPAQWGRKDRIIHAFILELRRNPSTFWNAALIQAFYPMLSRLRHRLVFDALTKSELDQLVLTAFLDVVSTIYLVRRPRRVCLLIRQATQRQVFRSLRNEVLEQEFVRASDLRDLARREEELSNLSNGDEEDRLPQWPETAPSKQEPLSPAERDRLVAFLVERVGDDIEEDRLNLVIATQIYGEHLSKLVRRLYPELADGDKQRMYQKIKRRHSRALVRLRELLADLYCPQDPPADALPLGSDPDSQGGMER